MRLLGPITAEWVTRCKREQASPTTSRQGGYQVVERMACWALFSFFILSFLFSFFFFYSTLSLSLSFSFSGPCFSVFWSPYPSRRELEPPKVIYYGTALGKRRLATAISLPETSSQRRGIVRPGLGANKN